MHFNNILAFILLAGMVACSQRPASSISALPTVAVSVTEQPTVVVPENSPTATLLPAPDRLLTICLGREPASLFYYDAASTAARDVLAAIYDGPVDIQSYKEAPVILQNLPSLENDGARLQPVEVKVGDLITDLIVKTGENIVVRRFVRYELSQDVE